MHDRATVAEALRLRDEEGLGARKVAARLGLSVGTVRDWHAGNSTDLTSILCTACDCLGLHWTAALPSDEAKAVTIYVSRKADVARMDEFVGPKA